MEKVNKVISYTGTSVSPADVVHIIREEVTLPGNRMIDDDADSILSKASAAHLSELKSSTKRRQKKRMEQKRRVEQEKRRKGNKK